MWSQVCLCPWTSVVQLVGTIETSVSVFSGQSITRMLHVVGLLCKCPLPFAASDNAGALCSSTVFPLGGSQVSGNMPSTLSICLVKLEPTVVTLHRLLISRVVWRRRRSAIVITDFQRFMLLCCIVWKPPVQSRIVSLLEILPLSVLIHVFALWRYFLLGHSTVLL